jgi:3-deoxy-D-arabino-heptulosonate 7-phosphate (DAHP) synthase
MANEKFYTDEFSFTKAEIEEARKNDTFVVRKSYGTSNKSYITQSELYSSTESFDKDR